MNAIRACLQEATLNAHRSLDQLERVRHLLSPALSVAEHIDILARMVRAAYTVEAALGSWQKCDRLYLWDHPRLSEAGMQDLCELGLAEEACQAIPLSPIDSDAAYAGALYVLEGSALGGHFIALHWKRMGLTARPCRYFQLDPHGPQARWHGFCAWLEAAIPRHQTPIAINTALWAFSVFHQNLSGETG